MQQVSRRAGMCNIIVASRVIYLIYPRMLVSLEGLSEGLHWSEFAHPGMSIAECLRN